MYCYVYYNICYGQQHYYDYDSYCFKPVALLPHAIQKIMFEKKCWLIFMLLILKIKCLKDQILFLSLSYKSILLIMLIQSQFKTEIQQT